MLVTPRTDELTRGIDRVAELRLADLSRQAHQTQTVNEHLKREELVIDLRLLLDTLIEGHDSELAVKELDNEVKILVDPLG